MLLSVGGAIGRNGGVESGKRCGDLGAGLGEDRGRVRAALAKDRDEVVNQAIDVIGKPGGVDLEAG